MNFILFRDLYFLRKIIIKKNVAGGRFELPKAFATGS